MSAVSGGHGQRWDRIIITFIDNNKSSFVSVVVDRKNDPKAETGGFELIYRQQIPPSPAYMGLNLFLKGQQITQRSVNNASGGGGGSVGVKRDKFNKDEHNRHNNNNSHLKQIVARNISSGVVGHGNGSGAEKQRKGPVIMDLLDCLDVKQQASKRMMGRGGGGGQGTGSMVARHGQGFLKSRNKVDVDFREKSNAAAAASSRRHHSCGPVILRQQSTMKSNTPRVVEDGGGAAVEEPFIVPVPQGDSNLLLRSCFGNKVDQKEDVILLPPVIISSSRKSSSELSPARAVTKSRTSPKGK